MGASPKPSGVLIGHTEGITYVSAKGDGRYIISNGKDQALRLWDLRKMRSDSEYESVRHLEYGLRDFDYRSVIKLTSMQFLIKTNKDMGGTLNHDTSLIQKTVV